MAARSQKARLEARHTLAAFMASLLNEGSSVTLTTMTPSDFLTGMDLGTSSTTPTTTSAAGIFGADPTTSSSLSSTGSMITMTGTLSPSLIFDNTATLSSETGSLESGGILTASATPDFSSSASQVLFPSMSTTFGIGVVATPSASSASRVSVSPSPTQTQGPEPTAMGSSSLSGGALAAAIVVPVIAVALFAAVGVFMSRRRQRQKNKRNDAMFAPETAQRGANAPPYIPTPSVRTSQIPWPITGITQHHDHGQAPRAHGSRPSLAGSNPFSDSRAPSNASQTFAPTAITSTTPIASAQHAEQGSSAYPEPQGTVSPPRPGTGKLGPDDDAISAISDVDYQQAEVGIAHRVSVIKPRGSGSHPPGTAR